MKLKNSIFNQLESDLLAYGGFDPEYFKQGVNDEANLNGVREGKAGVRPSAEGQDKPSIPQQVR
jgi:hypothetical protein